MKIETFPFLIPIEKACNLIEKLLFIPKRFTFPIVTALTLYYGSKGLGNIIMYIQKNLGDTLTLYYGSKGLEKIIMHIQENLGVIFQ